MIKKNCSIFEHKNFIQIGSNDYPFCFQFPVFNKLHIINEYQPFLKGYSVGNNGFAKNSQLDNCSTNVISINGVS